MATSTTFDTPGTHAYEVPPRVTEIEAVLQGAEGGDGGPGSSTGGTGTGASGAKGGELIGTIGVSPGADFEALVGGVGGDGEQGFGTDPEGAGGSSPLTPGGDGGRGAYEDDNHQTGAGGGGGGETGLRRTADSTVVGRAGGGGGGGGGFADDTDGDAMGGGGGGGGGPGGAGGRAGDADSTANDTGNEPGADAGGSGPGGDGGHGGEVGTTNGQPGSGGGTASHADFTVSSSTTGGAPAGAGAVTIREPPKYPANAEVVDHDNTSVGFEWDDTTDEDGYVVEFRLAGASSWTQFSDLPADTTTETVTGLQEGRDYEFRIGAYDDVGTSYTPALTQRTDLPAPTQIEVTNADSQNVLPGITAEIAWVDNATDEAGYRVYLSTDLWDTQTLVSGDLAADTESYTADDLLHGERYQVGVAVFTQDTEVLVRENV